MISNTIKELSSKFLEAKNGPISKSPFAETFRKAANKSLKPVVKKNQKHFIYKSSPGRPPNWASVPWLGIFDPNVTTSPQRGYYLALLFSVDMKRIYLSMNQGMTDLEKELGTKGAAQELLRRAEFIRNRVGVYKNFFEYKPIDLSIHLAGSTSRPMLYEKGHAFGKEYDLSKDINEDELTKEINNMLNLYSTLIFRGGIEGDLLDEYVSDENNETKDDKSNSLTETRKIGLHRLSERSSTNSRKVKKKLGYTCQVCGFNFKKVYGKISLNKKKEEFIEAHHKIPIHSLPENETIEFNIDDFAVLCSNCHRMAHKRKEPYTIEELKGFMKKRK